MFLYLNAQARCTTRQQTNTEMSLFNFFYHYLLQQKTTFLTTTMSLLHMPAKSGLRLGKVHCQGAIKRTKRQSKAQSDCRCTCTKQWPSMFYKASTSGQNGAWLSKGLYSSQHRKTHMACRSARAESYSLRRYLNLRSVCGLDC